jgi:hypothetical protein
MNETYAADSVVNGNTAAAAPPAEDDPDTNHASDDEEAVIKFLSQQSPHEAMTDIHAMSQEATTDTQAMTDLHAPAESKSVATASVDAPQEEQKVAAAAEVSQSPVYMMSKKTSFKWVTKGVSAFSEEEAIIAEKDFNVRASELKESVDTYIDCVQPIIRIFLKQYYRKIDLSKYSVVSRKATLVTEYFPAKGHLVRLIPSNPYTLAAAMIQNQSPLS